MKTSTDYDRFKDILDIKNQHIDEFIISSVFDNLIK